MQVELNYLLPFTLKEIVCVCVYLVGLCVGLMCIYARLCLVLWVPITSLVNVHQVVHIISESLSVSPQDYSQALLCTSSYTQVAYLYRDGRERLIG